MSVVEESGDDVMLSDTSPTSPGQGLGSPIVTALINIGGDNDIFARFVLFPSEGVVDLVERPPQADRSCNHQVRSQRCIRSQGPFRSLLPYDLKTGLLIQSSVADTGGKGAFTQQAHGEFIVSSETKCPLNTQQAHGEYF